ncbi:MAG TPA: phosphopyruvate hydratase, partial [Candidatus Saccharibacteria bacterium]|nr:phosphopyruvate hydratase [Candidatus Saccharibacteria bacterium]
MKIKTIKTRWILDSLGKPTVEVDIYLENGSYGRASVPTGISTSISEASELWDKRKEFKGYGVSHALNIVEHSVAPLITGIKADNQEAIDAKLIALDSTPNKTVIGSNVCLAVSVAVAKAAAQAGKLPLYAYLAQLAGIKEKDIRLPIPMIAVLGGGL